jgi:LuxR family maltose regulon positive regulatory protein
VLAGAAAAEGDERRALEILDNLRALGEVKRLPRLMLAAIAEQIRIHALRSPRRCWLENLSSAGPGSLSNS